MPHGPVDAVDVEERRQSQQRHVRGAEYIMGQVCGKWAAEEDESDGEKRGSEKEGEEE